MRCEKKETMYAEKLNKVKRDQTDRPGCIEWKLFVGLDVKLG